MRPAAGAGSSTVAFSDSSRTTFSSRWTVAPSGLSQSPISTSVMDSPTAGTLSSIAITLLCSVSLLERLREQLLLFQTVGIVRTGGGAGRFRAADAGERKPLSQDVAKLRIDVTARAHVFRFFLHPEQWGAFVIFFHGGLHLFSTQRIKLLQANNGDAGIFHLRALLFQIPINLPGTKQDAGRFLRRQRIGNDGLKHAAGKFIETRRDAMIPQERFGRHHDQRLAPAPQDLPAEQVKILRGGGRIRDLHVMLGSERKKAFQARTGMFRSSAFKTVREQKHQPGKPPPFVFRAGNELINYD